MPKYSAVVLSLLAAACIPKIVLSQGDDEEVELNTACDVGPDAFGPNIPLTCFDVPGTVQERRCAYSYIPPCAIGKTVPLVYDIHGYGLCPLWSFGYTGWSELATEECFILVMPVGITDAKAAEGTCFTVPGGQTGELDGEPVMTSDCCCQSEPNVLLTADQTQDLAILRESVIGTVLFFDENPDVVFNTFIDKTRIYFAGHSNGCITSLAMATQNSDIVSAVCCHAGAMISPFAESYSPVPIWTVHGGLDTLPLGLPFNGFNFGGGFGFLPVADSTNLIADQNGCDETIIETQVEGGTSYRRTNCTDGADVELVVLPESGHTPYMKGTEVIPGVEPTTVDTTAWAWDFCKTKAKAEIPAAFFKEDTNSTSAPSMMSNETGTSAPSMMPNKTGTSAPSMMPSATTEAPTTADTPTGAPSAPTSGSLGSIIGYAGMFAPIFAFIMVAGQEW